jgi:hypothetical protein
MYSLWLLYSNLLPNKCHRYTFANQ